MTIDIPRASDLWFVDHRRFRLLPAGLTNLGALSVPAPLTRFRRTRPKTTEDTVQKRSYLDAPNLRTLHNITMPRLVIQQATRLATIGVRGRHLPLQLRSASTASATPVFNWEDPLASKTILTEDEIAIAETAERYCQEQLLPRVLRSCPHLSSYQSPSTAAPMANTRLRELHF